MEQPTPPNNGAAVEVISKAINFGLFSNPWSAKQTYGGKVAEAGSKDAVHLKLFYLKQHRLYES